MKLVALLVMVVVPVLLLSPAVGLADEFEVDGHKVLLAEPVDFPPDTVMLVASGCYACDAYDRELYRFSRAGTAPLDVERVFPPAEEAVQVTGMATSEDGGLAFASVL